MTSNRKRQDRTNPSFLGGKGDQGGLPTEDAQGPEPETLQDQGSTPDKTAGTWIEHLSPNSIEIPAGYIESEYDEERMSGLQGSLAGEGQDSPVNVILTAEGAYILTGGKHRCEAAVQAGWETVRCEVKHGTMHDARRANVANAMNQSKPSDWSVIQGLGTMSEQGELSPEEIISASGCSPKQVEDRLLIWFNGSPEVRDALRDKLILLGHALALAEIEDHQTQDNLLQEVYGGMSVAELRAYIQNGLNPPEELDPPENEGQHPVAFNANNNPAPVRKALKCSSCGDERETLHMETIQACPQCLRTFRDIGASRDLRDGTVPVPAVTVREAINWLAGNPGGAKVAELLEKILERAESGEGAEHDG